MSSISKILTAFFGVSMGSVMATTNRNGPNLTSLSSFLEMKPKEDSTPISGAMQMQMPAREHGELEKAEISKKTTKKGAKTDKKNVKIKKEETSIINIKK